MDKRPRHKIGHTEPDRSYMGNSLELTGTRKTFLNRTQLPKELITTVIKWDLMKLGSVCTAREAIIWI